MHYLKNFFIIKTKFTENFFNSYFPPIKDVLSHPLNILFIESQLTRKRRERF